MGVAARCPQTRMAYLILGEIRRYTALLQVTHAATPKGVHTARRDPNAFAERFQNPPANVSIFQWRTNSRLEHVARSTAAEMRSQLAARIENEESGKAIAQKDVTGPYQNSME